MTIKAFVIAYSIAQRCRERGWKAYIVGGYVRDLILDVESKDIDVEVFGPQSYAELMEFATYYGAVNEAGESFNTLKVHIDGEKPLDLSLPRRDIKVSRGHKGFITVPDGSMTLYEASLRRDFTFNAMFLDPITDRVIDYHHGTDDLNHQVLRHVGEKFAQDPLRVLRGAQFCGRYNLTADADTVALCRTLYDEYDTLPIERIEEEWIKLLTMSTHPSRALVFLHRTGWLNHYPQLAALVGVPQDPRHHPEGSVYRHTLQCVDRAAKIAHEEDRKYSVLAALLHDVGKPLTTVTHPDGKITSYEHENVGADIALDFMNAIHMTEKTKEIVVNLVREHMTFTAHSTPTPRTVRRLSARLWPATIRQFVTLVHCDLESRGSLVRNTAFLDTVQQIAEDELCDVLKPDNIILGRHLIALGLKPGPHFSTIIDAAYEAQLDGIITDTESGMRFVAEQFIIQ